MDAVFRRQIERVSRDGATVLLSSHILSEVEQLSDRITIIRSGKAVESGTLGELRHLKRTHFRVSGLAAPARLAALPGTHGVSIDGSTAEFDVDAADLGAVLAGIAEPGIGGLSVAPPSLESLFLRHYSDRTGSEVR
jgi:ABC-2 type transport system ATP-binding protein